MACAWEQRSRGVGYRTIDLAPGDDVSGDRFHLLSASSLSTAAAICRRVGEGGLSLCQANETRGRVEPEGLNSER